MKTHRLNWYGLLPVLVFIGAGCSKQAPPLKTADNLDVTRYMGIWHEIARLPFSFEKDCYGVSAKYEPLTGEEFLITNYCWEKSFFGPMRRAKAKAWIEDTEQKSKLKVSFFWPIALDYWVLYVDENYTSAIVGTPDRKYLWIMSRTAHMEEAVYRNMVERSRDFGFDVAGLIRTPQRKDKELESDDKEGESSTQSPETSSKAEDGGVTNTDTVPSPTTPTTGDGDAE